MKFLNDQEMLELAREERNRYKREWYEKNKARVREYNRNYRRENADRIKQNEIKRLAKKALERRESAEN